MTGMTDPSPAPAESSAPAALVTGEDGLARPPWAARDPLLRAYYDDEWGLPVTDEHGLYERLVLEAFQSGLSWRTVLAKRPAFRAAFAGFDPEAVAAFGEADTARLLTYTGIIRNRAKVAAAIANARAVLAIREEAFAPVHAGSPGAGPAWDGDGDRPSRGLAGLVWSHQPVTTPAPRTAEDVPSTSEESRALTRALKARGFRFVGPTTLFALLEAVGVVDTHLVGSHRRGSSGIWR